MRFGAQRIAAMGQPRSLARLNEQRRGVSIPLLPLESRIVFVGDSKIAQSSSPGLRNFGMQSIDTLNGALRYASSGDQGISGDRIADVQARVSYTTCQLGDVTGVAIGHNSLNLGSATVLSQLQTLHNTLRAALPGKYIIWTTVLPSYVSSGTLYPADNATLVAVNDWIMTLNRTDGGYTRAVSFGYRSTDNPLFDPQTMCHPEATTPVQYIHPNELGGAFCRAILGPLLSSITATQTYSGALTATSATGDHGANLDPNYNLTGSEGTTPFAGTGSANCSGTVPQNKTVTNNTSATVVCTVLSGRPNGNNALQIDITGTVSAEGYVQFACKNASGGRVSASPGDVVEFLCGYQITHTDGSSAPVGVIEYGALINTNVSSLSLSNYQSADTSISATEANAIGPRVARTYPRMQQALSTVLIPGFGVRLAAGTVNVRLIVEMPIYRKTALTAVATPVYMGLDGIHPAAEQIGLQSGTVANGNTLTFRYGAWSGGGLSFAGIRIYQGDATNTGNGTGSLLTTLAAGTMTWVASGLSSGSKLYIEVDVSNGIGGTITQRSAAINIP